MGQGQCDDRARLKPAICRDRPVFRLLFILLSPEDGTNRSRFDFDGNARGAEKLIERASTISGVRIEQNVP